MKRFFIRSFLVAGMLACGLAAPGRADACGGGDFEFVPAIDYRPQGLLLSENDLAAGKYDRAAARVIRMFPELRKATIGIDPMIDRAYRVLALATARSDGTLAIDREVPRRIQGSWLGATDGDRDENLRWSADAMTRLNEKTDNDPALQSELGEALARAPGRERDALDLLGKLAEKDLLASPEAYAALADLRGRAGDAPGREAAMQRCETMAQDKAVCGRAKLAAAIAKRPADRS